MAELNDTQRDAVKKWLAEGASLSDVQNRLGSEFGLKLTYMDVRLLVVDTGATIKEKEKKAPPPEFPKPAAAGADADAGPDAELDAELDAPPAGPLAPVDAPPGGAGRVTVEMDRIMKPGALVSGTVAFSDGVKASWSLDQYGRLGLGGVQPGYRPPAADVQEFQAALQRELARNGYG